jgi:riboflavin biosynthesis pyrimidine reductase
VLSDRLARVRRLFPDPSDQVDLRTAYAVDAPRHVRANFVASADGSVSLQGKSGTLGNAADRELFHLLRAISDVVLVGAGTARVENYGGAREVDGRTPPIAVVSRSLDLDPQARLFTDTRVPPIVLTCADAPADRREQLAEIADVVVAGEADVDMQLAVDALAERGLRHVECEGGPHLLGWLIAAGLLDELCLTVAPVIAGGQAGRIVAGLVTQVGDRLQLLHVLEDDGFLFLRYSTAVDT